MSLLWLSLSAKTLSMMMYRYAIIHFKINFTLKPNQIMGHHDAFYSVEYRVFYICKQSILPL